MAFLGPSALAPVLSEPVRSAAAQFAADNVEKGLEDVAPDKLRAALNAAVARVAGDVAVKPEAVQRLLPMSDVDAVLAKLAVSQPRAVTTWHATAGGLGGLLGRSSQIPGDGLAPALSDRLRALASTMQRDKALAEPLAALAEDIAAWEALLDRIVQTIASAPALKQALRVRQGKRIALLTAIAAAFVLAAIVARAAYVARAHALAAIGKDDPCAAFDLGETDLGRVSSELRAQVDTKRKTCEDRRAEAARKAEEERVRKEKEEAARKAREKLEADCDALAAHVEAGKLTAEDEAFAADGGLTKRIAEGTLESRDIGPDDPKLPCDGMKAQPRIWDVYQKGVLAKPWIMLAATAPGPKVRAAFAPDGGKMPFKMRKVIATRANDMAKFANRSGKLEDARRASAWCEVARAVGMPMAGPCDIADKLSKQR